MGLSKNRIEVEKVQILSEPIRKTRHLGSCEMEDKTAVLIGKALEYNKVLTELDLSLNNFQYKGGEAFWTSLKVSKVLEILEMHENDMKGVKSIGKYLKINNVLVYLNLQQRKIGDETGEIIGESLKTNRGIVLRCEEAVGIEE